MEDSNLGILNQLREVFAYLPENPQWYKQIKMIESSTKETKFQFPSPSPITVVRIFN